MGKFGLLICLIILFGLLGCTQTPPAPVTKYVCPDGKTTVEDITTCPPSAAAPKELSEEEKALEVCSGMPSTQMYPFEDICIIGVAGKYENSSICKEVSRDQRQNCYKLIAEVKDDPSLCEEAESMADQCYGDYASDKKDSSICAKISDINYRDSCYDRLANQMGDAALCDKITNANQKDNCVFSMAMRFGDSSYCNNIRNNDQKQNCISNIQGRGGGGIAMPATPEIK